MKTTDIGYINQNNQKNLGCRGVSETHFNQKFFEMECLDCGHKYLANGCDIWLRKCPNCGQEKKNMESTDTGYVNQNNQKNLGCRGVSQTHFNQKLFEMECLDCGHKYLANGCEIWVRKCPNCGKVEKNRAKTSSVSGKNTRTISVKLRYQVFSRDNFKCCICGASPAKDPGVELHVDHILPWSRGGETVLENLQTLCSLCNLGKSNSL